VSEVPRFLTIEELLAIHRFVSLRYVDEQLSAPDLGVRDFGLLESAAMAAQATFDGRWLYETVPHMAGALWHSLVVNHPFVDGNKRVGLAAASTFLRLNGYRLTLTEPEAVQITLGIASGSIRRDKVLEVVSLNHAPL
jgi:death on curing protein